MLHQEKAEFAHAPGRWGKCNTLPWAEANVLNEYLEIGISMKGIYVRIGCIFIRMSFFNLCVPEKDTCGEMYNNRSLCFGVTFRVGQKLVSPSLCLKRQAYIHPRELE